MFTYLCTGLLYCGYHNAIISVQLQKATTHQLITRLTFQSGTSQLQTSRSTLLPVGQYKVPSNLRRSEVCRSYSFSVRKLQAVRPGTQYMHFTKAFFTFKLPYGFTVHASVSVPNTHINSAVFPALTSTKLTNLQQHTHKHPARHTGPSPEPTESSLFTSNYLTVTCTSLISPIRAKCLFARPSTPKHSKVHTGYPTTYAYRVPDNLRTQGTRPPMHTGYPTTYAHRVPDHLCTQGI